MRCTDAHASSLAQPEIAEFSAADTHRIFQHSFKYRLQFAGRFADDLQHFRGRRLLLKRFAQIICALMQFVEEPRVLDGDDGLCGEVLDQLDLFVGKWPHLGPIDGNRPEEFAFFHHWNDYQAPKLSSVYLHLPRFIFEISWLLAHIDDVNRSTSPSASRQGNI